MTTQEQVLAVMEDGRERTIGDIYRACPGRTRDAIKHAIGGLVRSGIVSEDYFDYHTRIFQMQKGE